MRMKWKCWEFEVGFFFGRAITLDNLSIETFSKRNRKKTQTNDKLKRPIDSWNN